MTTRELLVPKGSRRRKGNKLKSVRGVTIHNTGNTSKGANADANARYQKNSANDDVNGWHWTVDEKEAVLSIPENEIAEHSGKREGNDTTVAIEICENVDGDLAKATDNGAYLAAQILKRQGYKSAVSGQNLFMHYQWSGKNCLPLDTTELLTREGWKKLENVEIGEEIMCADPNTLDLFYGPVLDKVTPYKATVYKQANFEATLDHRILAYSQYNRTFKEMPFGRAFCCKSAFYIPRCGSYKGSGLDLTDNEIRLLVAIQADGHLSIPDYNRTTDDYFKQYNHVDFHLAKKRKVERLEWLLQVNGYDYKKTICKNKTVRIKSKQLLNFTQKWLPCKQFTWELLELNRAQAEVFLEELIFWDGNDDTQAFYSENQQSKDVVIAVAALNNVRTLFDRRSCRTRYTNAAVGLKADKKTDGLSQCRKLEVRSNVPVSCVTVDSGFILIRQERQTTICGNCPSRIRANQPYGWDEFVRRVNAYMSGSAVQPASPTPAPVVSTTKPSTASSGLPDGVFYYRLKTKERAYFRSAPVVKSSNIMTTLNANTNLKYRGESGDYYKVSTEAGKIGYVAKKLLVSNWYGSKTDVKAIQSALKVTADGLYGYNTAKAVEAVQRANGLTVDGIYGPNTKKALMK